VFAGLFAYVNVSPLLFMQGYGVSKTAFAALFAITASGVIVGSSINAWLLNRHVRAKTLLDTGLALDCLAALALLAVGLAGAGSAVIVAILVMVFISAFGLVFPNAVHEAIHPLPEIAGLASAVVTTTQMLFGALGGVTAAALYRDASPTSLGAIMSVAALAGGALYAFWLRKRVEG
jgi:DHA1 family bicyclomycin/chloramphenicol resistance-like MFS transporter